MVNLTLLGVSDVLGLMLFLFYDSDGDDHETRSFVDNEEVIVSIIVVLGIVSIFLTILVAILCFFHITL